MPPGTLNNILIKTGKTPEEAVQKYAKALKFHLEGLAEDGLPVPEPAARAEYVAIP